VSDGKVVVTRHIKAPPADVYEACTLPDVLAQWFGPKAFDVCQVEADVRVGGRFSFRMEGPQGTYGAAGVYREVTPPTRIVLTWMWTEGPMGEEPDGVESLVTFDIREDGRGTRLTLTHERLADQASADSHGEGWAEALEKLARRFDDDQRGGRMAIAKIYGVVCTANLATAKAWYTRLFGRAPDLSPMSEVHEWHHERTAGLQLLADGIQAGHSKLTLIVSDIEETRAALSARGLALGTSSAGDFATVAQIADPDGNIITFAQPGRAAGTV
jgi:uncharacterized protein YndB with AHSA1/START domain/predicted enzyme related to lactoylglutathione lyase